MFDELNKILCICSQLNFHVAINEFFLTCIGSVALILGAVPDGAGQIWLDNVNCRGTESRLIDCSANPLGNHNCVHAEDAGVRCSTTTVAPGNTNSSVLQSMEDLHHCSFLFFGW